MDERIVVSLSVSHINGRLEGLKKKLAREIGHEPDVAEIRQYVQDLAYAAIDEDIKPRPMTFYVKLVDGKPTGQIEVGRELLKQEDREAKLYLDEESRKWTMRHSPVDTVLWTFATNQPLELWIGGQWVFGYIDVSIPDLKPSYYFQAEKGGFCGLLNNMDVRVGRGMGWTE